MDTSRKTATINAAGTLISNIMGVLFGVNYSRVQIERACEALFALDWSPGIAEALGPQRVTRLFTRLKISKLSKQDYAKLLLLINLPTSDQSGIFPFSLEGWRSLLVRFDLERVASFPDWLTTIHQLKQLLVETPEQLALFSFQEATGLAERVSPDIPLLKLWQAACISAGSRDRGFASAGDLTNASLLAQSIRSSNVENSGVARRHKRARELLNVPEYFDQLGPAAKVRELSNGDNPISSVQNFLSTGAPVNILRQAQFTLPSIASGIQCWVAYCNLVQQPYFPPTSQRVCAWASLFKTGGSFGNYVTHLTKACQILNVSLDWNDSSVAAVARGLRKAHDLGAKFDNYMYRDSLQRFLSHETLSSDFGLLGYLSFLFLLRVQSECLPIRRAEIMVDLFDRAPAAYPALIGLRIIGNEQRLILKLARRKNQRYGSILMRPCFCSGGILVPRQLCPVHVIWPLICQRTEPSGLLFPSLQRANLNRILKASLRAAGFPMAERYTMYCFRRGCLMEMKKSNATVAQIMRTAGWRTAQFKVYLDLHDDEERVIRSLMRDMDHNRDSDIDSEVEYWDVQNDSTNGGFFTPVRPTVGFLAIPF